ncbi:MAG: leucine-rich repeat domain-containing protein [Spirochaetaceae bacterium]|nr:leucine-rich repeat domain-containing protein [Spirochaetaceae bacterium]
MKQIKQQALFMAGLLAALVVGSVFVGCENERVNDGGANGDGTVPSGLGYERNEQGGATITGYNGPAATAIVIPAEIEGLPVTAIGERAFFGNGGIPSVTIPASVTAIGDEAFQWCSGLASITVDQHNTVYASIDGVLFTKNQKTIVTCPGGKEGAYTIPGSVTAVGDGAFAWCKRLASVIIPDGVTSIGGSAFAECSGLTSVTIGGSVTSIGDHAFAGCERLTSVIIPDGVAFIREGTFNGCERLASVTIPDGVTAIEKWAFSGCERLTSVTIPGSVSAVGDYAFSECWNLTSVTFGAGSSIRPADFGYFSPFPSYLRDKYLEAGPGTYTRPNRDPDFWTKQP